MRSPEAEAAVADGLQPIMIVTLETPLFTLRAAEVPISIEDPVGDAPYFYDARLIRCADLNPEVSLFDLERGEIGRASIEIVFPESVSPAAFELLWYHLAASRVEVATVWPDQAWKDREVWIGGGTISGLKLGVAGQPVSFVAEALPQAVGDYIGEPDRTMGASTIGSAAIPTAGFTNLDGKAWPVIVGRCYRLPGYKFGATVAGQRWLGLAGHQFAVTTSLTYYENSNDTAYTPTGTVTVTNGLDDDNAPYCAAISNNTADFTSAQGAFTFDATYGGVPAARGRGSSTAALGANGVVAWLLANSGCTIDWYQTQAALEKLTGWEMGVYIDKPTEALKVLRDRVLPYLPLIEEQGADGIWLRYADPFGEDPDITLIRGQHLVDRLSDLEQVTDPDDLRNRVTLRYYYDHYTGEYLESVTVDETTNPRCALSWQLYGPRADNVINCNVTWDAATALRMANARMDRLALPRFRVSYLADPALYWLREGAVVLVTDDDLGLSARRCVVRKRNAKQNPGRLVLETVPGLPTSLG